MSKLLQSPALSERCCGSRCHHILSHNTDTHPQPQHFSAPASAPHHQSMRPLRTFTFPSPMAPSFCSPLCMFFLVCSRCLFLSSTASAHPSRPPQWSCDAQVMGCDCLFGCALLASGDEAVLEVRVVSARVRVLVLLLVDEEGVVEVDEEGIGVSHMSCE